MNSHSNAEQARIIDYLVAQEDEQSESHGSAEVETAAKSVIGLAQVLRQLDGESGEMSFSDEDDCASAVSRLESLVRLPLTEAGPVRVLRNYELLDELGSGGMGVVFRARHTKLGKEFAVKVLSPKLPRSERLLTRFHREMRAAGKIEHENVVCATDADEASGVHFLAMELVEGGNLAQLIKARGPLAIAEACEITRRAALGLVAIHEQGLVHRDIKPSNLMITAAGQIKVMDLGLALLQDPGTGPSSDASQIVGTIQYMAPEQLSDPRSVDCRADLYSLGCTLHYLLVGQPPGPRRQQSMDHVDVDRLLDRLLALDPNQRFETSAEVAAALAPLSSGADLSGLALQAREISKATIDTVVSVSVTLDESVGAEDEKLVPNRLRPNVLAAVVLALAVAAVAGIWSIVRTPTGELVLRIDDPSARVFVDGQPWSDSAEDAGGQLRLQLPVGSHEIQIQSVGNDPWSDRITISANQPQTMVVDLQPEAGAEGLVSQTDPSPRERELAEWVFRRGGKVRLYPRGDATASSELPDGLVRIQNIVLTSKGLADKDANRFVGMSNLQGLELSRNQLTSDAIKTLSAIKSLRWLYLPGNRGIDDRADQWWASLSRLQSLDLSNTQIKDGTVAGITELEQLRELRIAYCGISDESLIDLARIPSLVRLDLRGTKIGDRNVAQLQLLPNLKYLLLSSTGITDESIDALSELTGLVELELKQTQLTAAAIRQLQLALPHCRIES